MLPNVGQFPNGVQQVQKESFGAAPVSHALGGAARRHAFAVRRLRASQRLQQPERRAQARAVRRGPASPSSARPATARTRSGSASRATTTRWSSQGRIANRKAEHLGTTDRGVVLSRRMLDRGDRRRAGRAHAVHPAPVQERKRAHVCARDRGAAAFAGRARGSQGARRLRPARGDGLRGDRPSGRRRSARSRLQSASAVAVRACRRCLRPGSTAGASFPASDPWSSAIPAVPLPEAVEDQTRKVLANLEKLLQKRGLGRRARRVGADPPRGVQALPRAHEPRLRRVLSPADKPAGDELHRRGGRLRAARWSKWISS